MARPEHVTDLSESLRSVTIGSIDVSVIADDAFMLRAFADLAERVQAIGGKVEGDSYRTLSRPKTDPELQVALRQAQQQWDRTDARWKAVQEAETEDGINLSPALQDYEKINLRAHAAREGYPELDSLKGATGAPA